MSIDKVETAASQKQQSDSPYAPKLSRGDRTAQLDDLAEICLSEVNRVKSLPASDPERISMAADLYGLYYRTVCTLYGLAHSRAERWIRIDCLVEKLIDTNRIPETVCLSPEANRRGFYLVK